MLHRSVHINAPQFYDVTSENLIPPDRSPFQQVTAASPDGPAKYETVAQAIEQINLAKVAEGTDEGTDDADAAIMVFKTVRSCNFSLIHVCIR